MVSIKERNGSEQMKNSNKRNQSKTNNRKQVTSNRQTNYNEGSYFNPYAKPTPVQSNKRSTYKAPLVNQKREEEIRRNTESRNNRKSRQGNQSKLDINKVRSTSSQKQYTATNKRSTQQEQSPQMIRAQMRKSTQLTRAQIYRIKKRKQRQLIIKIAALMLFTTLGVWGVIELKEALTKPKISYQVVKTGVIDDSKSMSGIILRNEQVVYSQDTGNVQYVISEGEKVKKDGLVYVLVDEEQLAQTTQTESEIDEQIYNNAENRKDISFYQDQIYNLDEDVRTDIDTFYDNRYENITHYVYVLRGQLDQNINKRTSIYTKEQEERKESIAHLKTQIETDINRYRLGKTAPQAGIVSYKLDGQETANALEVLETLNYDKYNSIIKDSNISYLNKTTVTQEEPLYKIILDNKWYVVSYVDISQEEAFKEGESYILDFIGGNGKQIKFKLTSKKTENDKRIRLVFETNDQIGSFLESRYVDFSIGNKNVKGLKIPLQAIVEQNMLKVPSHFYVEHEGKMGVYRKTGEVTEFLPTSIQYRKDDYIYIRQDITNSNGLQVNNIIVDGQTGNTYEVTEIETKQGVYVINGKMAQFKTIEIDIVSGEYAIIKDSIGTQLKEMDKIISNPKSIRVDQLLKDMSIQNE